MIRPAVLALSLGCTFVGPALAETRAAVTDIAAAISLAEAGIVREDARLLITALEVFSDLGPAGAAADTLRQTYEAEARFLLRGDPALSDRLDRIEKPATQATLLIFDLDEPLALPEGQRVKEITLAGSAVLRSVSGPNGKRCVRLIRLWRCDPKSGAPSVTVTGVGPAWIIVETQPSPK